MLAQTGLVNSILTDSFYTLVTLPASD